MTDLDLPAAIAAYFAADERAPERFADCFVDDAIVKDEKETHAGRAAINRWRAATVAKYAFTSEPLTVARRGDDRIVVARVSGGFPGSPIELTHRFRLRGGRIESLEIG